MEAQISRPDKEYKEAFVLYSGVVEDDFEFKVDGLALAYYEGITFRICHYNDLLWEIKTYFKNDFNLIYTETTLDLWIYLYDEHSEITQENLIIDLYSAWKLYWEQQSPKYVDERVRELSKEESWKEFSLLIDKIQSGPGNIIENAINISDITLIPILALALRMQFKNEAEFYKSCIDILIEEFSDEFGIDGNFDEVALEGDNAIQRYFIYIPDYNFDDKLYLLE